ncbi:MAG: hypothetical protein OXG02_07335 [Chloroflexi bacterium]|nr:hypothetical protein [Anaerolineaceae bacterium]MCY4106501.1 hypothetical protein [Chloroflexota bacterium]
MAEINLTQAEADALFAMEKHRVSDDVLTFPYPGQSETMPLQSVNKRENFLLDLRRGRIELRKVTMQTRARQIVVLARLDLEGAPHRNPDGNEISTPHLHLYREGYGDKWAQPVPLGQFPDLKNIWTALDSFMRYCNITKPPLLQRDLFS